MTLNFVMNELFFKLNFCLRGIESWLLKNLVMNKILACYKNCRRIVMLAHCRVGRLSFLCIRRIVD